MSAVLDLIVIGGGPAGASAAIAAARLGFKTALLEAGRFPRHKVCGEFVSGEALSLLDELLGRNQFLPTSPRLSVARVYIDGRVLEFPISPAAASVSRYNLDLALWQAAASCGVVVRERAKVLTVRRMEQVFEVELQAEELHARAVVNASGRWSNLTCQGPLPTPRWIGLKAHYHETTPAQSCDLYFFEGGYCGVQPLSGGIVNAAAMVRAEIASNLQTVFSMNRELKARSRNWQPAIEPVGTAPLIFRSAKTQDRGMILAGDAAAFIDPFAGDGISMALHSGRLAVQALTPYLRSRGSMQAAMQEYESAHRQLIQPALRNAANLRRLIHLPKPLRLAALSLLRFPPFARAAVQETRVRQAV